MGAAGVGMPPVSLCRWSGAALSVLRGGLSTRRKSSFQSWLRVRTTWEVWQGLMPGTYCPPPKSHFIGFPGGSDTKEFACSAGDPGSIPGSRRSPREESGFPL